MLQTIRAEGGLEPPGKCFLGPKRKGRAYFKKRAEVHGRRRQSGFIQIEGEPSSGLRGNRAPQKVPKKVTATCEVEILKIRTL